MALDMARKVNQEEYELRRNEILDTALQLAYARGYEQMSIQDILTTLHISKGAFYHYFASKQDLLEGLIERISSQGLQLMEPIARDESLKATEKLLRLFDFAARWKTARKDTLMNLVRTWYADENAVLRQKTQAAVLPMLAPVLTQIIRQGVVEGAFHTRYPEHSCEILFSLLMRMGDSIIEQLIHPDLNADPSLYLEVLTASYQEAMERILGATPGSLPLFDPAILREWFPPVNGHN